MITNLFKATIGVALTPIARRKFPMKSAFQTMPANLQSYPQKQKLGGPVL